MRCPSPWTISSRRRAGIGQGRRLPSAGTDIADPNTSATAPFRLFNIGNNRSVALTRYIELIEENMGRKAIKNMMPIQPGDVPATESDVTALKQAVGYEPETPVEDGVRRFVAWYKDYYGVN